MNGTARVRVKAFRRYSQGGAMSQEIAWSDLRARYDGLHSGDWVLTLYVIHDSCDEVMA